MSPALPHDLVPAHAARTTRVVVVADTHGRLHPGSLGHIAALDPDAILHAGDIGALSVLDELATLAPVYAVRGNIDGRVLPDTRIVDVGALRILLLHIGVNGPRLRANVARQAAEVGAGLVVCGHSHVPLIAQDRGHTVFNPGSLGPRRFSLPIVFGTLELRSDGAHLAHIDAQTGEAWTPPA